MTNGHQQQPPFYIEKALEYTVKGVEILRAETIQLYNNRNSYLTWGSGAIGLLFYTVATSGDKDSFLTYIILCLIIPLLSSLLIIVSTHASQQISRNSRYLRSREKLINLLLELTRDRSSNHLLESPQLYHLRKELPIYWEHQIHLSASDPKEISKYGSIWEVYLTNLIFTIVALTSFFLSLAFRLEVLIKHTFEDLIKQNDLNKLRDLNIKIFESLLNKANNPKDLNNPKDQINQIIVNNPKDLKNQIDQINQIILNNLDNLKKPKVLKELTLKDLLIEDNIKFGEKPKFSISIDEFFETFKEIIQEKFHFLSHFDDPHYPDTCESGAITASNFSKYIYVCIKETQPHWLTCTVDTINISISIFISIFILFLILKLLKLCKNKRLNKIQEFITNKLNKIQESIANNNIFKKLIEIQECIANNNIFQPRYMVLIALLFLILCLIVLTFDFPVLIFIGILFAFLYSYLIQIPEKISINRDPLIRDFTDILAENFFPEEEENWSGAACVQMLLAAKRIYVPQTLLAALIGNDKQLIGNDKQNIKDLCDKLNDRLGSPEFSEYLIKNNWINANYKLAFHHCDYSSLLKMDRIDRTIILKAQKDKIKDENFFLAATIRHLNDEKPEIKKVKDPAKGKVFTATTIRHLNDGRIKIEVEDRETKDRYTYTYTTSGKVIYASITTDNVLLVLF